MTGQRGAGQVVRYAPKGTRPLVLRPAVVHLRDHAFVPQTLDPVSCVRCNLPARNGRHAATSERGAA